MKPILNIENLTKIYGNVPSQTKAVSYTHLVVRIKDISGGSRGTSIYFVRASGYNDKIYRIASLSNQFVLIVSQSASRIISAVPFLSLIHISSLRTRLLTICISGQSWII